MTLFSRRSFALGLLALGLLYLCLLAGMSALPVHAAPTFNSGSTGADGPFAPTADVKLQVPDSGVFNFTTVNIPSGVAVTFTRNATNTPITILASGDVNISGYIDIRGGNGSNTVNGTNTNVGSFRSTGGAGGPGGFDGGSGGSVSRIAWNNADGGVMLWKVDSAFGFTVAGYGPCTDNAPQNLWSATAVSAGLKHEAPG